MREQTFLTAAILVRNSSLNTAVPTDTNEGYDSFSLNSLMYLSATALIAFEWWCSQSIVSKISIKAFIAGCWMLSSESQFVLPNCLCLSTYCIVTQKECTSGVLSNCPLSFHQAYHMARYNVQYVIHLKDGLSCI